MVVLVEAADNNVFLIVTCIHQTFVVVCTLTIDTFNIGSKRTLTIRSVPLHNFLFFFNFWKTIPHSSNQDQHWASLP